MTADDNKRLIVRYLETLDSGDQERVLKLVAEIVADDYVAYWAGATYRGRDTLKSHISNAYLTFGEMRHTIEDNLAEGDTVQLPNHGPLSLQCAMKGASRKGMKQTKPAQAMKRHSLSPVLGRPCGRAERSGRPNDARACDARRNDRCGH